MADFLFLFRINVAEEKKFQRMDPEAMAAMMRKWKTWTQKLAKGGHLKGGERLGPGGQVVKKKGKLVTDGPFTESKDMIGGYLSISAKNMAEAVRLSKGCPILEGDNMVEVRPVEPI